MSTFYFCNYMVSFLPTPENLAIRIIMVLASTVFVAFGKQRDKLLGKTEETAQIIRELFQKKMGVS